MKKLTTKLIAVLVACFALFTVINAQDKPGTVTRKVYTRSADPLLIAMILSGKYTFDMSPEPTSIFRLGNSSSWSSGSGFGNSNSRNGHFGG